MPDDARVCPACGARNAPEASVCDLCGHDFADPDFVDDLAPDDGGADHAADLARGGSTDGSTGDGAGEAGQGVFCIACGARNPAAARFCSRCGVRLVAPDSSGAADATVPVVTPAAPARVAPPAAAPPVPPESARRIAVLVVGALLLVAGLYLATVASKQSGAPAPAFRTADDMAAGGVSQTPAGGAAPAAPAAPTGATLSATDQATVTALENRVAAASGAEQAGLRRELANLLIGLGQPERAGDVEAELARVERTAAAWRRAGDRYYEALQMLPEDQRSAIAPRVVAAYDSVLAREANDLDARTRLGWAAQYDATGNPMRAITETNAVLERDSTHLGASYNRGWFLVRIGRVDQAKAQFRKVQRLAGADSPLGREAQSVIETLDTQQTPVAGPQGAAPPAAAPSSAAPARQ